MNAEPSARAKFGAAFKHQQKFAAEHPELFEKAQEILRRINSGEILWSTGIMVALQEGQNMAASAIEKQTAALLLPTARPRRSRVQS